MHTETKLFEVRDRATFIPVIATHIKVGGSRSAEDYLARRGGWQAYSEAVYLYRVGSGTAQYDPFEWGDRTMQTAHQYIAENWRKLDPGSVIDVEFILGESAAPKASERENVE